MKKIIATLGLLTCINILQAQTPFDDFDNNMAKTPMLKLQNTTKFIIPVKDSLNQVAYLQLDVEEGKLDYYTGTDSLLLSVVLKEDQIKFLSVDPLTKDYPMLTPYQFASNSPISGIDLDGLEYLSAHESRIKMIGGDVHIKLSNFSQTFQSAWHLRTSNPANWPQGNIGFPTNITQLEHPSIPKFPDALELEKTQIPIKNPIAKSTGLEDQRFKQRTVSGAHPKGMTRNVALASMAVNTMMWGLEKYMSFEMNTDKEKLSEHLSILKKQVLSDLSKAIEGNMIPEKYMNLQDLGNLANVILSGETSSKDKGIKELGLKIVKEISQNYKPELEVHTSDTGSKIAPADNVKTAPKVIAKPSGK